MECFPIGEWKLKYANRSITLEDLSKIISPGSNIFIGSACSEPKVFTKYIAEHRDQFQDCRLFHFFSLSDHFFATEEDKTILRHNTLAIIGNKLMRKSINQGYSDFTPVKTSDIPEMILEIVEKSKLMLL
jgi:acyl-CoA hydrolase